MGYQKIVINGGNHNWCILLISLILLLVTSSSATFDEISDISLNDVPGVWRGIPEVTIETVGSIVSRDCQICVDDTYWNTDIADIVCQYNGFEGSMIVKRDTTPAETGPLLDLDGYAVCRKTNNSELPLECEFRETCARVPTISCLVPGYQGCYSHTVTDPFFSDGVQAELGDQQVNILTCAEACSDSPYLGLANGQDCICGSALGDRSLVGVCDLECQGDDLQQCGGVNAISVYGADVIGECGTSTPVELTPNQPYYVTSLGFPGRYEFNAGSCTWTMVISVTAFHDLEVLTTFDLGDGNQLSINAKPLSATYSGQDGTSRIVRTPYAYLQDTITVSFTVSSPSTLNDFHIKFSLTPNSMYTSAPDMPTLTNVEQTGPTTAPIMESTTSKAMQAVITSSISTAIGVVIAFVLVV
ncbi:uncharacterized protein in LEU2 3'region [Strongylocentrotus purpuratus]|uniref:Uncharacterized protein n=1 Tax=Strongylocentrotus purpuratus TaxID=7668 RepID=A0A7M7GIX7_STRPU|nr:uncharacterized protein in LEU2 3'region [Strongylocentrotus purpuratus]